ncbi:uncharacterized protein LOC129939114 [Eupeodes corollae]|uniref:uncharacterized protein LOC129939114 n=1 Tax=Eupeodes corollae TaxID=290404 RepID=UPI00248FC4E7|nr:uncharacterized protein LOC129939114 [Eupeodes corollae]
MFLVVKLMCDMFYWSITFGLFFGLLSIAPRGVLGQIAYTRHISNLRIKELMNLADRLDHSIYQEHPPCERYYEYVCNRNQPMFSIMGNLPSERELISLWRELQNDGDGQKFEAKNKMLSFHLSCCIVKSVDDCYRETFDYFRPVFGYIVAHKHMEMHDHQNLIDLLERFISRAKNTEHFGSHLFKFKMEALRERFKDPRVYFKTNDLDEEYKYVRIYNDGYDHNIKALEELRKSNNSTYMRGVPKTILDWTMYMYQSRNKPMSYYMSTLNVHLWMMFYNSSARMDPAKYGRIADCLKLPPVLNVLDEARLMAVIYIKSFQQAWAEYRDWIVSTPVTNEIYDHENEILKRYKLDNKRLFFTLYAQNFCDFGKEIAENVFFLGLKQNQDFYNVYSCGYQTPKGAECF